MHKTEVEIQFKKMLQRLVSLKEDEVSIDDILPETWDGQDLSDEQFEVVRLFVLESRETMPKLELAARIWNVATRAGYDIDNAYFAARDRLREEHNLKTNHESWQRYLAEIEERVDKSPYRVAVRLLATGGRDLEIALRAVEDVVQVSGVRDPEAIARAVAWARKKRYDWRSKSFGTKLGEQLCTWHTPCTVDTSRRGVDELEDPFAEPGAADVH